MSLRFGFVLCISILYLFTSIQQIVGSADMYRAAVVDYAAERNPDLDPAENIYKNVRNYQNLIRQAYLLKAEIIVFPEEGLIGKGNQVYYSEIPSSDERIIPCAHNVSSMALTQLSCAARTYEIYVVINLPEVYYNTSSGETKHFNTDVVFDTNGTIIARYRKYNLFGENSINVPELEHVSFKTDFGVMFGMFICFDIDFKEPALSLVRDYNIQHFVFSSAWISELPFLTAIQTQWAWAYSLDVVLLASGYNYPLVGSTGSGIYQGRRGALTYTMTDTEQSRLLVANVPKTNYSVGNYLANNGNEDRVAITSGIQFSPSKNMDSTTSSLMMYQDFINLFRTGLLPFNEAASLDTATLYDSKLFNTLEILTTICQRSICCDFNISVTITYQQDTINTSSRGDDYNQYYYRLAAFDGVRTYSGFATGGIQLCSVIACVDDTVESCGLRADDVTATPVIVESKDYGNVTQSKVVFNYIQIDARFVDSNSLIFPDVFVTGVGDSFGALVASNKLEYLKLSPCNGSVYCELKTSTELNNLITFGIYSRQFDRDGQPVSPSEISSLAISNFAGDLFFPSIVLLTIDFFHFLFQQLR